MVQPAPSPTLALTQLATAFWVSRALYVAAKLGVADELRAGPKSSATLAAATNTDGGALYRVLRALASVGVFAEGEDGRFSLTATAELLRSDAPGSLRAFIVMQGEPECWLAWGDILHSVRTARPAFEHAFGAPLFKYLAEHPEAARVFDEGMTSRGMAENEAVLAAYDFSGAHRVIDVGAGAGTLLTSVLLSAPAARGVLFDLPHVVETARASLANDPVVSRLEFAGGDFLDAVPSGGDLYLLKKVIHNWDDERARLILRACRRAMRAQARLLLIEPVVAPGNEPSPAKLLDLMMLVWPGGQERTEDEYRALLASAGFELRRILPTKSPLSLVEAVPR